MTRARPNTSYSTNLIGQHGGALTLARQNTVRQPLGLGLTLDKKSDFAGAKQIRLIYGFGSDLRQKSDSAGPKIVDSTHHHGCDMWMWQKMILPKKIGVVLKNQRIHGSVYFCIDLP